jgi:outer membrane receptor protein involved in Fe transport
VKVPIRQWALAVLALLVAAPALAQEAAAPESEAEAPLEREADADQTEREDPERAEDADADEGADQQQAEGEVEQSDDIEEIIVEGTTTETSLDVPTSVTTFSGSDIQELRIQDIADLSAFTPNLEINTAFAASNPTLFIRGIGLKDYNANSASAVAVYQDGIAISSPAGQLFQMFDVQSVEVLRGPQGSLNGRNATAGAIMVESVKPDGEWSSTGSAVYGNYNDVELEGAIGFPLIDEMLSGRVAFTYQRRDGITKNACSGHQPPPDTPRELGGVHSFRITEQTMREEYEKDKAADNLPSSEPVTYKLNHAVRGNRQRKMDRNTPGVEARYLQADNICITGTPGEIVTAAGEANGAIEPDYVPHPDFPDLLIWNSEKIWKVDDRKEGEYIRVANIPALEDFADLKSHTNDADNWAVRGMLRAQPITGMDLLFNAHGGQNRSDSFHMQMVGAKILIGREKDPDAPPQLITDQKYQEWGTFLGTGVWNEVEAGEEDTVLEGLQSAADAELPGGRGGADPYLGWYNRDGKEKLDVLGFSLTARQEFDAPAWWVPSLVTSVSGYEENQRLVDVDGDGSPGISMQADYSDETWQVSQELRIEGEGESFWWVLGGYYLHEELDSQNFFPGTLAIDYDQNFVQDLTHLAPFVHGRYDFTDLLLGAGAPDYLASWSLEAGARYNWENKTFSLTSTVSAPDGSSVDELAPEEEEKTWTGLTGDVTLSYKPFADRLLVDDMTLYAKYSRGMKGGHFNAGLTTEPGQCGVNIRGEPIGQCQTVEPVEPEFIDAVAWFQYWYKDLQVFDIVNDFGELPTQQLLNSDAAVMGVELELQARPLSGLSPVWGGILDGLFLKFGGGWLDSEFLDFEVTKLAADTNRRAAGLRDTYSYDGNPLIAAPEWNFAGMVEWEIPLSRWGSLVPQYNFSYRSRISLDPSDDPLISQPSFWLHNARLAYRTPDGRIEVAGWVDNFMDEHYLVDVFDTTRQFHTILQVWGMPRTYGLNVSFLF